MTSILSMNEDLQSIFEHPVVQRLAEKAWKDLESEVKLPFVLKDKILMSPGVWNNFYYNSGVIKTIFQKTNWDDPKVRALFLDHVDDRAAEWIGEIINPKFINGNVVGDLAILDKPTAIKLAYGAKFGVSPKVIGEADYNRRMYDGHFDNFSVVINPAVKTTFLNSEIKIKGGKNMPKTEKLQEEESEASEEEVEEPEETEEESTEEAKVEELAEKVAEILKKKKYPYEKSELKKKKYKYPYEKSELEDKIAKLEAEIEELKKKKPEEEVKEAEKKKKYEYPEEMGEEFAKELSAYTDFVKDFLKKNPEATIKDAAKAWSKKHSEELGEPTITVEDLKMQVGELVETKMSQFGVKPIRIAQKFIDPSNKEYDKEIEAAELDRAMFDMIKEGVGV